MLEVLVFIVGVIVGILLERKILAPKAVLVQEVLDKVDAVIPETSPKPVAPAGV